MEASTLSLLLHDDTKLLGTPCCGRLCALSVLRKASLAHKADPSSPLAWTYSIGRLIHTFDVDPQAEVDMGRTCLVPHKHAIAAATIAGQGRQCKDSISALLLCDCICKWKCFCGSPSVEFKSLGLSVLAWLKDRSGIHMKLEPKSTCFATKVHGSALPKSFMMAMQLR